MSLKVESALLTPETAARGKVTGKAKNSRTGESQTVHGSDIDDVGSQLQEIVESDPDITSEDKERVRRSFTAQIPRAHSALAGKGQGHAEASLTEQTTEEACFNYCWNVLWWTVCIYLCIR